MKTRMKEYRARLGMTQEKLAEAVGVRRETIIFLEQGKYNPSLKVGVQYRPDARRRHRRNIYP